MIAIKQPLIQSKAKRDDDLFHRTGFGFSFDAANRKRFYGPLVVAEPTAQRPQMGTPPALRNMITKTLVRAMARKADVADFAIAFFAKSIDRVAHAAFACEPTALGIANTLGSQQIVP
jgi:hypothetical protein